MNTDVSELARILSENGHRITAARQAVLKALVASGGHITADDLAEKVRRQAPQVGRMTVYRTLDLLSELGAIRPIFQGTGAAHYVLMDGGSHHHLICSRCHQVIEFEECTSRDLAEFLSRQFNFQVQGHLLEVHGICEACSTMQ